MPELVFFEDQRLERAALHLANGAEVSGQIVGDTEDDFHVGPGPYPM